MCPHAATPPPHDPHQPVDDYLEALLGLAPVAPAPPAPTMDIPEPAPEPMPEPVAEDALPSLDAADATAATDTSDASGDTLPPPPDVASPDTVAASAPTAADTDAAPAVDPALVAALLAEFDAEFAPVVEAGTAATTPAPDATDALPGTAAGASEDPEPVALTPPPLPPPLPRPTRDPATPRPSPFGPLDIAAVVRAAPTPAGQRWLRMAVGEDRYAVELLRVQEVVRMAPVIAVRGAVPSLLGVMNLRGRVVPVHDLGLWLRRDAVTPDDRARIVVLEDHDELTGLLVTSVTDVVTLDTNHIEPLTPGLRDRIGMGIARTPGAPPTVLLDAHAVFA